MSGNFIDSNVLVYLFEDVDLRKMELATQLVDQALDNEDAVISFQVVQEVLNVVTKKVAQTVRPDRARFLLDVVLEPMWRVMPSLRLYEDALRLHLRYGFSFHDGLIVAAALESGCTRLFSEDLQHGQRIDSLTIEDPFR
jgi:predicted nucleic acid-binding protein